MSQKHSTTSRLANSKFKDAFNPSLLDAAAASRELKDLIAEVHGLNRLVKAGKVARPKQIKRIGKDLARWEAGFNALVLNLAHDAVSFGGEKKVFSHVGDNPAR